MVDLLQTKIEFLKGVGPKRAELLNKELSIFTYQDMLDHFPFRYVDKSKVHKVNQICSDAVYYQLVGTVSNMQSFGSPRVTRITATFTDETGSVELVWFQGLKWIRSRFRPGMKYLIFGKANFFNNRLTFTGDFYYKKTDGMLLNVAIPSFTGFADPEQNAGTMFTKGWEIKLGWTDTKGDFTYSVGVNLSNYKSVMGDLKGTVFDGETIIRQGDEYNAWYGYVSDGLFQSQEEIDGSALLVANTKPGDIRYVDISGPDGVPDGKITADYDRVILGSSQPKYIYGGYINLGWKGISFSMVFSGVGKHLARMNTSMIQPFEGSWLSPSANLLGNYWSVYNTAEQNSKAKYPRLSAVSETNNYAMSDFWLFNGAFFRCKNINIGYSFPKKLISKIGIKSLRIYANVDDPFCFDNYPHGWDPEASVNTYITTTYTLGLDIKF